MAVDDSMLNIVSQVLTVAKLEWSMSESCSDLFHVFDCP